MEKSNGVCLDEDIILFSILPRLPAKVLTKFKCVSKNWRDIISNDPRFIHLQFQWASASPCLLFQVEGYMTSQIYGDRRSVGFPSLYGQFAREAWMVVGSCNGILGIVCFKRPRNAVEDRPFDLYVGNPVLKEWRLVPYPRHSIVHPPWGLGLVVDVNESVASYKLVIPFKVDDFSASSNIYNNPVTEYRFEVLSSETGSWEVSKEKIMVDSEIWLNRRPANVLGTLFWEFGGANVLWFEPKEERSGLLPLPFDANATGKGKIGEWDGKLSYTTIKNGEIHVWIKNKLAWSKMHSISFEFIVERNFVLFASLYRKMRLKNKIPKKRIIGRWLRAANPIAYERNVLLFSINNLMLSFDMETRKARKHGIGTRWFAYKSNTFISLPGP